MVEVKDCQQQETEGKLQSHSCLTLMAQVWFLAGFNSIHPLEKNDPVISMQKLCFFLS